MKAAVPKGHNNPQQNLEELVESLLTIKTNAIQYDALTRIALRLLLHSE